MGLYLDQISNNIMLYWWKLKFDSLKFPTDALHMVADILIKEHTEVTTFRQEFSALMHSLSRRVRNYRSRP